MSAMYSTTERLVRSGQTFSSRRGLVTVLPEPQNRPQRETQTAQRGNPTPVRYPLTPADLDLGGTGSQPGGQVEVQSLEDGTFLVRARVQGIPAPVDPALHPTLWLIHDLRVPTDLAATDLARLPGAGVRGWNLPGQIFTLDGNPPDSGVGPRVVSVPVRAGELVQEADGSWSVEGRLDHRTNRAAHPLVLLGPGVMPSINASLPSGTVAGLLTDLLMRQGTLYPDLPMPDRYPERLASVAARWLVHGPQAFLPPDRFDRAAVTVEGPVRHTPTLVPSPRVLLGGNRAETG